MKSMFSQATQQFLIYILITAFGVAILGIIYTLRDLIGLFLVSCFFALLLWPFVVKLKHWKIPDILGILITFFTVFLTFTWFFVSIIPVFVGLAEDSKGYIVRTVTAVEEAAKAGFPFIDRLPLGLGGIIRSEVDISSVTSFITDPNRTQFVVNGLIGNIDIVRDFIQKWMGQFSTVSLSFASWVTSALATFALFILLTFFIILERRAFVHWFFWILPTDLGGYFRRRQHMISHAIHAWLRGQLLLALFMFFINLLGLWIAQWFGLPVSHIFSLALIAGFMEFVPYLWPVISFVPAFLMVLVSPDVSFWAVIAVIGLYVLFQQLEGNIMVPLVMSKMTNLSSLYILIMTLVWAAFWWALGVLLAIPLASVLHIFYHDWMHYRKMEKSSHEMGELVFKE
jgi:predicted PurR-regulated permease PerM